MRRLLIASITAATIAAAIITKNLLPASTQAAGATATPTTSSAPTGSTNGGSSAPSTGLRDGTYTGSSVDAYYGNVQVRAVISGGRLTDVQFIDYPRGQGRSQEISNHSLPILKSEAIQAQSAQVDAVSGASDTSQAFDSSLQSALSQAS